jgi:hypothetical protein
MSISFLSHQRLRDRISKTTVGCDLFRGIVGCRWFRRNVCVRASPVVGEFIGKSANPVGQCLAPQIMAALFGFNPLMAFYFIPLDRQIRLHRILLVMVYDLFSCLVVMAFALKLSQLISYMCDGLQVKIFFKRHFLSLRLIRFAIDYKHQLSIINHQFHGLHFLHGRLPLARASFLETNVTRFSDEMVLATAQVTR